MKKLLFTLAAMPFALFAPADAAGGTPAAEPQEKRRTIGDAANDAIRDGKTNEEALAIVKAEFPTANTTMASINWYRNKLRKDGEKVPSARDLKAADAAANPPAPKPKKPTKAEQKAADEAAAKTKADEEAAAAAALE